MSIKTRRDLVDQKEAAEKKRLQHIEELEQSEGKKSFEVRDAIKAAHIKYLYRRLRAEKLVPIIGDTVRNEKLFDIDDDMVLGVAESSAVVEEAPLSEPRETEPTTQAIRGIPSGRKLSITEQLAIVWAKEIKYPLVDCYRMARVAQYQALKTSSFDAKWDYLEFQKSLLLKLARRKAKHENDKYTLNLINQLERDVQNHEFTYIVKELDLPRYKYREKDPLDILARLPIKYYVTTGYYDFIERALEANGKKPRTRLSLLNINAGDLKPEHCFEKEYVPTVVEPMVIHLYGLADYQQSIVLTEDDYIDYLMRFTQGPAKDKAGGIIPPRVLEVLTNSSLLLLGYRLHKWDFRLLFRIIKKLFKDTKKNPSVSIQLKPEDQLEIAEGIGAVDEATEYLKLFFDQAHLKVHLEPTDNFLAALWDYWDENQGGG